MSRKGRLRDGQVECRLYRLARAELGMRGAADAGTLQWLPVDKEGDHED
jgi:hypothetical protein